MEGYEKVLKVLSENNMQSANLLKVLNSELSLPNIPTPTMGGEVFWNNIAECNGWKLQQNMITHHARILNSDNVRIAWGTINGMLKAMDRMVQCLSRYNDNSKSEDKSLESMDKLKKLKELLDIGAITEDEYLEKKNKLLRNI